jgi:hypothetical protein
MSKRAVSLVSFIFFLLLVSGLILSILSDAHEPRYYCWREGRLYPTREFKPLDKVVIYFPSAGASSASGIKVQDAAGRIYHQAKLTPSSPEFASFMAGGSLGIQHIFLLYKENGKPFQQRYPFSLHGKTEIHTGIPLYDSFPGLMKEMMLRARRTVVIDGKTYRGYGSPDTKPIFLRDYVYQMKGARYYDPNMLSIVDLFLNKQKTNGGVMEFIWNNPQTGKGEVWDNDLEADKEYLVVLGAYQAWQVTGEDGWIKAQLPRLEKALRYSMTDPFRWSSEYQMVKRPFTIDTWDFEYHNPGWPYNAAKAQLGVMHGDNSGMYLACKLLSDLFHRFGEDAKSKEWLSHAEHFKQRVNEICWNGKFYTHQIHLTPVQVEGVDEKEILSLSNPMDINRGVADHAQAVSIINEYMNRWQNLNPRPFAEWFSIQPNFPTDSFETTGVWTKYAGEYVNGGIMPLVGAELARAGFDHGFEKYGVSVFNRYYSLVTTHGKAYLWYYADGRPGVSELESFSSDGWGASLMMNAFMEGLAGIRDQDSLYNKVAIRPCWEAAGINHAYVIAHYPASDAYAAYQYQYDPLKGTLTLELTGSGSQYDISLLLPKGKKVQSVLLNGKPISYSLETIESSSYLKLGSIAPNPSTLFVSLK